jgi:hypothetical protein
LRGVRLRRQDWLARPAAYAWLARGDLLVLSLGSLALVIVLGFVTMQPPTRLAFAAGGEPAGVTLQRLYPVERNASFAFRWTQPDAALTVPVAAPARYRVVLTMQDNPAGQAPRPVTVLLGGARAGTAQLSGALHDYAFTTTFTPRTWLTADNRVLEIRLLADPLTVPGDTRSLGVVLARVTVEPAAVPLGWRLAAVVPNVLLLVVAYGALRGLGTPFGWATLLVVGAVAGAALLALVNRGEALSLAYEAWIWPRAFGGALLALAATPFLAALPLPAEANRPARRFGPAWLASSWGLAFGCFIATRAVFSLGALLLAANRALLPPCTWPGGPLLHATGWAFRLLGVWQRWDACYYENIATNGYAGEYKSAAFFPLYPLLMRAVSFVTAGDLTLAGLIVTSAAYVAALGGLYRLVAADFDTLTARWTVGFLAIFPTAFFLFAPFTEALFLALAIWTVLLARRRVWGWAALIGFLVALTRLQGVLLIVPVAWEVWRAWRAGQRRPAALAALVAPLAGLATFSGYVLAVAGLTTFRAQQLFSASLHMPWTVAALAWQDWRLRGNPIELLNLLCLLLCGALIVVGARRLPLAYTLYAAPQWLLTATRANVVPLTSTMRLLLVVFPLFVVLALLGRNRLLRYVWGALSLALLGYLLYTFLTGEFVA